MPPTCLIPILITAACLCLIQSNSRLLPYYPPTCLLPVLLHHYMSPTCPPTLLHVSYLSSYIITCLLPVLLHHYMSPTCPPTLLHVSYQSSLLPPALTLSSLISISYLSIIKSNSCLLPVLHVSYLSSFFSEFSFKA